MIWHMTIPYGKQVTIKLQMKELIVTKLSGCCSDRANREKPETTGQNHSIK